MKPNNPLKTKGQAKGGVSNLRPFKKGQSGNPGGRAKKTTNWKAAEESLREALPRILLMTKNDLQNLIQSNPTGAEMLASKYLMEHVVEAVNRFLGKTPTVLTGVDGKPLVPESPAPVLPPIDFSKMSDEQLDRFIDATAQANRKAVAPAPAAPLPLNPSLTPAPQEP